MIPTPFQGQLYDYGAKIRLTREFVEAQESTTIELKVIGVVEGMIPSEVSSHTFEVKEGVKPVLVQPAHEMVTRACNIGEADEAAFQNAGLNFDVLQSGGSYKSEHVESSPDMQGGNFFEF